MEPNPAQLAPYVAGGAFALAFVFGAVANRTDFCTMGAVSDWVNMGDLNRMRMWLLAIGLSLIAFAYASKEFRGSFDYTLGGVVTGLVVVGGWYVTGRVGYLAEDPNTLQEAFVATNTGRMEAFSFVAPLAWTL